MGALINLFKNIFGGIFGFIGGLFGGKSSDGYYLEAESLEASGAAPSAASAATTASSTAQAPVAAVSAAEAPADPATVITTALNMPKVTVTTSFAEQNAIPVLTGSRRRPGPSLAMFKDMAKGMGAGS
ncbi:MAG: hypothetical protein VKJ24_00340 [Synechococcales bacterium]|nr:hypothetical protein [Synechococcales bacterium]